MIKKERNIRKEISPILLSLAGISLLAKDIPFAIMFLGVYLINKYWGI